MRTLTPRVLFDVVAPLGLPLVLAGGGGSEAQFLDALQIGYGAVQMGTRFIATVECKVHQEYRDAIVGATEDDIVLTDRLSGVPCAVIKTPLIEKLGTMSGPVARWFLKNPRTKHLMRTFYALRSLRQLKRSSQKGLSYNDVFQAGKSAGSIHAVVSAEDLVKNFGEAARTQG